MARKGPPGRRKIIDRGSDELAVPSRNAAGASGGSLWLGAPIRMSSYLARFVEQTQRAETEALDDVQRDVSTEIDEARAASAPHQVLALYFELFALEFVRLGRLADQMWAGIFDAQSGWLRDLEACAADVVRPWLSHDERITVSAADPVLHPPLNLTPAGWLATVHRSWRELTKAWLDAVVHDLQDAATTEPAVS